MNFKPSCRYEYNNGIHNNNKRHYYEVILIAKIIHLIICIRNISHKMKIFEMQ